MDKFESEGKPGHAGAPGNGTCIFVCCPRRGIAVVRRKEQRVITPKYIISGFPNSISRICPAV
jgi:hypothetical protein